MNTTNSSPAQQFLQGLTSHSRTSILAAIAFVLITCSVALISVDEDFIYSRFYRYLASHPIDERLFTSERAYALFTSGNKRPKLVVVGGSATLVSTSADVVEESLGTTYEFYNLGWSRQSLLESLYLISRLPEGSEGVLVVGVGPSRVAITRQTQAARLKKHSGGFTSIPFDHAMETHNFEPSAKTGYFLIDNRKFLLARYRAMLKNLAFGAPQKADLHYIGEILQDDATFDKIASRVKTRIESGYSDSVELNLDLLATIISLVRSNTRMDVVIAEHPINPRFVRDYIGEPFYKAHKRRMSEFALEQGVDYFDLAGDQLDESSYFDWTHLAYSSAANSYTRALLEALASKGHLSLL